MAGNAACLKGTVLDVGCGDMPYRAMILEKNSRVQNYLGLDLEVNHFSRNALPDLTWEGKVIPLPDNSVDSALATELLEHCPDPAAVAREIYRVLKPEGTLLFTVPFIWPLHEVPHDYSRFTPFSLTKILENAGFTATSFTMLGGWDASLAQVMGLWVARRPGLNRVIRRLLRIAFKPVIWWLLKADTRPEKFEESQLFTGIGGVARK